MRPVVMKDNSVKESAAINRKLGKMAEKKCIRYCNGSDNTTGESEDNIGSVESMNSLEAPTPDSLYSTETNDNDGNDSRNHELESSEFSLSSPPCFDYPILSPKTVPNYQKV
ncbi:hypothetical protein CEXT_608681 [Caerostris extrusa]|uniref:Uncharacterized protein n=1 Tax=Caerostris extrusa TaxID=172846 RepID=A0AAV4R3L3_CAEEX|nr:hypothetical protein CEXT_608681 [Caerostris extrusa]